MTNPVKDRITEDLKQAKTVGQLRSDRIREIIRSALMQVQSEVKEGSSELRALVKEAFSAATTGIQTSGQEAKEEIQASIEGIIDGITSARRTAISQTEAEVKRLQAKLEAQEEELEQQLDSGIAGIRDASKEAPSMLRKQIEDAIDSIQNSEEVSLLKKRYAQLQAQAAILRANLSARSETYYDQAQTHLEDAKGWYKKARPKAEELKGQADERFAQLDQKIGEAGTALARREHKVRQILSDLLRQASDAIRDDDGKSHADHSLPPAVDRPLPPADETTPKL